MSISGINGGGTSYTGGMGQAKSATPNAAQEFLDYMKKSPEERMVDTWLQAHGITREEFDKMKPEEKDKIVQQMKRDIEEQIKEKQRAAAQKSGDPKRVDILA